MKSTRNFLKVGAEVALLGALVLGLATVFRAVSSGGPASQAESTVAAYPLPEEEVTVAEGTAVAPYPPPREEEAVPVWTEPPEPLEPPTPTVAPFPTLIPTPVVTPIPVAEPPLIPEVVGEVQQPFWIYYWQGNEVWRIDDRGQDRELLLDTYRSLGQWLTGHPMEGTDCCWSGVRVVVSPDGQKLALVVVDKIKLSGKGEPFTFSIYVFDVQTGDLKLVSEGVQPVWSPDGQRIAFLREDGLWIANLDIGQTELLVAGGEANPELYPLYWMWSPDGQRIAYRYGEGMRRHPELWIKNTADDSAPYLIPNLAPEFYFWCGSWMPDGQNMLCVPRDYEMPGQHMTVWAVNIETGDRIQLAQGFSNGGGRWSPDGRWLALSAARAYEREKAVYDLWLMNADDTQLLRVTSGPPQDLGVYWSPDGTRLVFYREGVGLVILSLETGQVMTPLDVILPHEAINSYAVGGLR